ncbi:MAG: hypothetical protein QM770_02875 [Tepidisphaeraceae bacterium]
MLAPVVGAEVGQVVGGLSGVFDFREQAEVVAHETSQAPENFDLRGDIGLWGREVFGHETTMIAIPRSRIRLGLTPMFISEVLLMRVSGTLIAAVISVCESPLPTPPVQGAFPRVTLA